MGKEPRLPTGLPWPLHATDACPANAGCPLPSVTRRCEVGADGGSCCTAPFLSKIRPGSQAGDIEAAGEWRLPGAGLAAPLVDIAEGIVILVTAFPSWHMGEPCA